MAPEQVERPREVDHRADIYALGVVFYEMLTGELPLGRFAPPSRKVAIDLRVDDVVLRSLEKEPDQRYQRASEVGERVEEIRRGPAPRRGIASSAKTRPTWPLVLTALILVSIVVAGFVVRRALIIDRLIPEPVASSASALELLDAPGPWTGRGYVERS